MTFRSNLYQVQSKSNDWKHK